MSSNHQFKSQVIRAYRSPVVRAYCTIRFRIMNMRILEEIGQYLPFKGRVLDVGCGFGLFSLYYALQSSHREIVAYDINDSRLAMARSSATALGLSRQTTFCRQDAVAMCEEPSSFDAAYMLDILHHVNSSAHRGIISMIHRALAPGGILVLKEIDTKPAWKVFFTWTLDMLMSPSMPPSYINRTTLYDLLVDVGFEVKIHSMVDILPYPHVLYICTKRPSLS